MGLVPLNIPPGMHANGTALESKGRWRNGNLVRWTEGIMQPVGGWQIAVASLLAGIPRAMTTWRFEIRGRRGAIGTSEKLYRYDGSDIGDITPSGLTPGREDSASGGGFGAGPYGAEEYGTAREVSAQGFEAATWSLDNFGNDLVAVRRDEGTVWKWNANTDTEAVAIVNAPSAFGLLVTDERHLVLFGVDGDPRKIAWSDREDYTTWTAAAANSAGDLLLTTDGRYIGAAKSQYGILIVTDVDAHVMRYVDKPFIYGVDRESDGCGLFGPQAIRTTARGIVWMGPSGFFVYDGAVSKLPCLVFDRVYDDLNTSQALKIAAGVNSAFNEVWWFYPSAQSEENDRYVVWNYVENHWATGELGRSAWVDQGAFPRPLACTHDGGFYEHETGWTDSGQPRLNNVYVESAPLEIAGGARVAKVRQLLNDETGGEYQVRVRTRLTPQDTEYPHGPFQARPDGYTDARFSGRQAVLRFEGTVDAKWQVGRLRIDVAPGGKR